MTFTQGPSGLTFYSAANRSHQYETPTKVSCSYCQTPIMDEGRNMCLIFPSSIEYGEDYEKWRNAFEVDFCRPSHEYQRFGLPYESSGGTSSPRKASRPGAVSPLIHLKGIRETSYGIALIALQYQGQETAVTTIATICAFVGLGDGFVVWKYGGEQLKMKALGHWVAFFGFGGWALWRTF
ncbi:DUF4267 domain-containing protein [Aspergillus tanneri]|uniref:Uncharacterized protein n=1 Tax=Aspergillus tanneri TaxID=1220188 RepID=A0A5M9MCA7_9EURO|nr:uncharacterized protein ATNIH1004_009665 [Aspergillus tanneri]KAA8642904.1 hypothetical protein ATNIH1004_009665 [Aspergillus tanneri]